jgi:hypothetical protein
MDLIAICLAGLEDQVVADLRRHLAPYSPNLVIEILPTSFIDSDVVERQNGKVVYRGEAACGKLLLRNVCSSLLNSHATSCTSSSASAQGKSISIASILQQIRSVQYLFLYLTHDSSVPQYMEKQQQQQEMAKKDTHAYLSKLVAEKVNIDLAYSQWLHCISADYLYNCESLKTQERKPTFCARCIRNGQHHGLGSMEIAKAIGEEMFKKTSWTVDLTSMDIEIVCLIMNECLVMGINIPSESKPFVSSKLPSEVRSPVLNNTLSPSLRPSTAFMMVQLANPQPGDLLVDCMCGSGSVMTEASFSHRCVAFGGDADKNLLPVLVQGGTLVQSSSQNKAVVEVSV